MATNFAEELISEQLRVDEAVRKIAATGAWQRELNDAQREQLLACGHFPEYGAELDWTPVEVVGHLTDSALTFADRISRLTREREPWLANFDTTATDRIERYRATPLSALTTDLARAQEVLASAIRGVAPQDLARSGRHETLGALTLSDIVAFLPGHQRDHAAQLEALLGPTRAIECADPQPMVANDETQLADSSVTGAAPVTKRITIRRIPERGAYDELTIRSILGEGLFCHVGFVDDGQPVVIPTGYGLFEDSIVVHGLPASRMLQALRTGIPVCITVTVLDGLVLAGSAFDHSMNYRSVVIFGRAHWIRDSKRKLAALYSVSEHLIPGRWSDVRAPNERELGQTHVLEVSLSEASAKVRSGPPSPEAEALVTWTGTLPVSAVWGPPQPDPANEGHPVPAYLRDYRRTRGDAVRPPIEESKPTATGEQEREAMPMIEAKS